MKWFVKKNVVALFELIWYYLKDMLQKEKKLSVKRCTIYVSKK